MRTFYSISAAAALITMALTSCGSGPTTASGEKELVYEGSMLEPQIGEQAAAPATADTLRGNTSAVAVKANNAK